MAQRSASPAKRPQPSPRQLTVMKLIRTADRFRRFFESFYAPYDLTPQQYNVLRILRGAGPASLPTMEIAERMFEKAPGVTRLLDRLEAKQLVTRTRHPEDRRQVLVAITAAGMMLLEQLETPVAEATASLLRPLDEAEVRTLGALLDRIEGSD